MSSTHPETSTRFVYSTLAAAAIAHAVEAAHPVGRIAAASLLRRGFNDVYELRLGDGRRCVARLSGRRQRGDPNIAYETDLLSHLKAAGGCVAAPSHKFDGRAWIALETAEGARTLAVFDHLEGEPPGENLADVEATGRGLANLHAFAEDYRGYTRVREIPERDFQAIASFAIVRQFWLMGEFASRIGQWGTQALPRPWLARQAKALNDWESLRTPGG